MVDNCIINQNRVRVATHFGALFLMFESCSFCCLNTNPHAKFGASVL